MVARLAALTSVTTANIVYDILAHGRPEEGAGNQLKGLGNIKVTGSRGIVAISQDGSLEIGVIRDADETFMKEKTIVYGVWALESLFPKALAKIGPKVGSSGSRVRILL
jgi:hypothetical protein